MKRTSLLLTSVFLGCALIVPAVASATPNERAVRSPSVREDFRQARRALEALERKLDRICPYGCRGARRNLATIRSSLKDIRHKIRDLRRVQHTPARYGYPELHRNMRHARNDRLRLSLLSDASHLPLSMSQTCGLLVTFSAPHLRLQALRIVQPQISDPYNIRALDEAFARRSDRRKARRIVWNESNSTDTYAWGRGRPAR